MDPKKLTEIAQMDNSKNMDELADIGQRAALVQVKEPHFATMFDIA